MTGIYVRVLREGRWVSAEFDQLSDAEMEAFVARQRARMSGVESAVDGWGWAVTLARWIRDHVEAGRATVAGEGGVKRWTD